MNFGEKLRGLRKDLGKSQEQAANDIGISQTYLSTLEQRAAAPRQEILELLARYYDVPITFFFDVNVAPSARERIDAAKEYLRFLQNHTPRSPAFAHSREFRKDDDDLSKQLKNLNYDEEDEYLDT